MGSSHKLWTKRLTEGDLLTRGQIGQYCHAIAAGANGYIIGGARTNLTTDECLDLSVLFLRRVQANGGFRLTREQTEFGIDWLDKDRKRALSVGITSDVIDNFREFRFVGTRLVNFTPYGRATFVPIYRVLFGATGHVDYSWSPWQGKVYA